VPANRALVTVGIPTFNRSALLPEAIASVLAQSYGDFVLEISDNASTDETSDVVAAFDDARIRYRRRPENVGMFRNWNQFYLDSTTDYVLVLPDDDLLHPRFLERTVAALDDHPRAGMVHTAFDLVDRNGQLIGGGNWTGGLVDDTVESPEEFVEQSMRWSCRVCSTTALVRVAAIPEGGMPEDDHPASDFALWLRVAAAGHDVIFLADRLASNRVHEAAESAAQIGPSQNGAYALDLRTVERVRNVKLRFIAEHGSRVGHPRKLRRLARWGAQYQILSTVSGKTLERRDLRFRRSRFLGQAAVLDSSIVWNDVLWRNIAADLTRPVRRRIRARSLDGSYGGRA
jgi:glycosyltransferase involved in cell wall biosynthesis